MEYTHGETVEGMNIGLLASDDAGEPASDGVGWLGGELVRRSHGVGGGKEEKLMIGRGYIVEKTPDWDPGLTQY